MVSPPKGAGHTPRKRWPTSGLCSDSGRLDMTEAANERAQSFHQSYVIGPFFLWIQVATHNLLTEPLPMINTWPSGLVRYCACCALAGAPPPHVSVGRCFPAPRRPSNRFGVAAPDAVELWINNAWSCRALASLTHASPKFGDTQNTRMVVEVG